MTNKNPDFNRSLVADHVPDVDDENNFDPVDLAMKPLDFSKIDNDRWKRRRIAIFSIVLFYAFVSLFILGDLVVYRVKAKEAAAKPVATSEMPVEEPPVEKPSEEPQAVPQAGTPVVATQPKPTAIVQLKQPVVLPENPEEDLGATIAKMEQEPMFLMMVLGFLGSVFFLIRTLVRTRRTYDMPVAWYTLRPFLGMLQAVFIYFTFRAGGDLLYAGESEVALNVWTLGTIAIVTGIFSEQAFDRLREFADGALSAKKEDPKKGE